MARGSDICYKVSRRSLVKGGAAAASLAAIGGLSFTSVGAQDGSYLSLIHI